MRLVPSLVGLSCLLAFSAHAEVQCMARFSGTWSSIFAMGTEITSPTHCSPRIQYQTSSGPQSYRLQSGPVRRGDQITCQWTWVAGGQGPVFPGGDAPESIVCNLFL